MATAVGGGHYGVNSRGGSSRFCVISLTYIGSINLCVLCVFVVRSTPSLGRMYLRIHFTHQIQESRGTNADTKLKLTVNDRNIPLTVLVGFKGNLADRKSVV